MDKEKYTRMVKRAYTPINNLNAWLLPSAPAAPVAAAPAGSGRMAEPYVGGKFPKLDAKTNTSKLEGKSSELADNRLHGERWKNYQKGENAVAGVGRVGKGKDGALYLSPDSASRERASARADELDRQQWARVMRDKLKELRKGNTADQLELGGAFNKSNVVTPDWMDWVGIGPWGLGNRRIPFTGKWAPAKEYNRDILGIRLPYTVDPEKVDAALRARDVKLVEQARRYADEQMARTRGVSADKLVSPFNTPITERTRFDRVKTPAGDVARERLAPRKGTNWNIFNEDLQPIETTRNSAEGQATVGQVADLNRNMADRLVNTLTSAGFPIDRGSLEENQLIDSYLGSDTRGMDYRQIANMPTVKDSVRLMRNKLMANPRLSPGQISKLLRQYQYWLIQSMAQREALKQ